MASNSSPPDFDSMKVVDLRKYLKEIGAPSSGNRPDLIKRAKLFSSVQEPARDTAKDVDNELKELEEKRKIFNENYKFEDVFLLDRHLIPQNFNSDVIHKYLKEWQFFVDDEEIDVGTEKPVAKGEDMYNSRLIQYVEYTEAGSPSNALEEYLIFRAIIDASYSQEVQ